MARREPGAVRRLALAAMTAAVALLAAGRLGDRVLGGNPGAVGWKQEAVLLVGGAALVGAVAVMPIGRDLLLPRASRWRLPAALTALAGVLVVLTTTLGLDQSLWHDEVFSVVHYTTRGPGEILTGRYVPNDHVLFNLVEWATSAVLGRSEVVFRLWSLLPALAAGAAMVWWAWTRISAWTSATLAVLIATSPIFHDLAREARGYGLTFLAGALMLVFADRAARGGRRRDFVGLGLAGVVGGFTIPQFVIGFLGQAVPLLARRDLRRPVLVTVGIAGGVLVLLYAPLLSEIVKSPGTVGGESLPWHGPLSAPAQDLLRPNVDVLVGHATDAYAISPYVPDEVIAGTLAVVGALLWWRLGERMAVALLVVPIGFVYVFLTVSRFHVHERYGSFLLFHALALAAVGIVGLVRLLPAAAPRYAAIAACVAVAAIAVDRTLVRSDTYRDEPREDFKGVAAVVRAHGATRIVTDSIRPDGLRYYLGDRNVVTLPPAWLEAMFCSRHPPPVFVEHPFRTGDGLPRPPDVRCLEERGARRITVRQRDRGGHIDVWLLPPA
jgi:hypothetical protein